MRCMTLALVVLLVTRGQVTPVTLLVCFLKCFGTINVFQQPLYWDMITALALSTSTSAV
jgi:hypothetical protein